MAIPCIAGATCVSKSAFVRVDLPASPAPLSQLDQIEAAGLKLMRIRSVGGGAQFLGKRMRRAA